MHGAARCSTAASAAQWPKLASSVLAALHLFGLGLNIAGAIVRGIEVFIAPASGVNSISIEDVLRMLGMVAVLLLIPIGTWCDCLLPRLFWLAWCMCNEFILLCLWAVAISVYACAETFMLASGNLRDCLRPAAHTDAACFLRFRARAQSALSALQIWQMAPFRLYDAWVANALSDESNWHGLCHAVWRRLLSSCAKIMIERRARSAEETAHRAQEDEARKCMHRAERAAQGSGFASPEGGRF